MTLFPKEIYSESRDPFLTVGKLMIVVILVGFLILTLHVILAREEMKLAEVEKSLQTK